MTRILITGATGFIGRHVVNHLFETSAELFLYVREIYSAGRPLPAELAQNRQRFNLVYGDLRHFNLTVRAVREARPHIVIHLAAAGASDPFLNPDTAVRHNVTGTLNLIRACFERTDTTNKMVVARTPGELTFLNVYAASKLAAWDFCRMYANTIGWQIFGGMIYQCYGPGQPDQNLVPAAAQAAIGGLDFPMTGGKQEKDWIHISDVVRGLASLAGEHDLEPGETVDFGTGKSTSVVEVVRLIYELAGKNGRPLVGALPTRPGETSRQLADAARTAALINWQPTLSLREGIGDYLRWLDQSRQPSSRFPRPG